MPRSVARDCRDLSERASPLISEAGVGWRRLLLGLYSGGDSSESREPSSASNVCRPPRTGAEARSE